MQSCRPVAARLGCDTRLETIAGALLGILFTRQTRAFCQKGNVPDGRTTSERQSGCENGSCSDGGVRAAFSSNGREVEWCEWCERCEQKRALECQLQASTRLQCNAAARRHRSGMNPGRAWARPDFLLGDTPVTPLCLQKRVHAAAPLAARLIGAPLKAVRGAAEAKMRAPATDAAEARHKPSKW